jgi:predicted CXXCH cytochrome family protein
LKGLLLARSPELCLTCHKDLKTKLEKEKPHSPATRGCERCHVPHFSKQESLLAQAIQPTCLECHSPTRGNFGKAHLNIDANVMDCKSCHDPHASKDPKFFKADVHAPFAARSCEECHIP